MQTHLPSPDVGRRFSRIEPFDSAAAQSTGRPHGRRPCAGRALATFTLIELLVVVAIISVLASMLLPVMGKARGRARSIVCANNFKQIATAAALYMDEHGGYIPAINDGVADGGTYSNRSQWWWGLGPYAGETNWGLGSSGIIKRSEIFSCPVASLETDGMYNPQSGKIVGYGMSAFIPTADEAASNSERDITYSQPHLVRNPSSTIYISDGRWMNLGNIIDLSFVGNGRRFYKFDRVRHDGGANLLYLDGHVEYQTESRTFTEYLTKGNNYWQGAN